MWDSGLWARKDHEESKFTEPRIAFILRQGEEGTAVGEICRNAGRRKYGGLLPSEMKRLRQLEEEHGNLKKIVAGLSLDKEKLQDVIRRSFEAYPEAATGGPCSDDLASKHSTCLPCVTDRPTTTAHVEPGRLN
jgi:putative transposase